MVTKTLYFISLTQHNFLTTLNLPPLKKCRSGRPLRRPPSLRHCSFVTIAHPPLSSSLKITNRSFRYASPSFWNNLPASFRQPRSSSGTTITPSITSSLFHSRLKTHLFHKSFLISYSPDFQLDFNRTAFTDSVPLCVMF